MNLQRRSGVALWRQIADEIRLAISGGLADGDGRLPGEIALAERFGVNRHTVRTALAALQHEGVVDARQGKGTFVKPRKRLAYPIGRRTRFSENVRKLGATGQSRVTASSIVASDPEKAMRLGLSADVSLLRVETVSTFGGEPVSAATHWFEGERFGALVPNLQTDGSITAALKKCGIEDYVRMKTEIEAMHATDGDLELLGLSPGAIVLVTHALNADLNGNVFQLSETRFAADRVTLAVEHAD